MSDKPDKISTTVRAVLTGPNIVPLTGPFFCIYAFFWPESFAHWWGTIAGTIVHLVRTIGGV